MDTEVVKEILNDACWLNFILEIKRNLSDYNQKEILSHFLIVFSSIFCDETLIAGHGGINVKTNISKKEIDDLRNFNLKSCFTTSSKTANQIIEEMGIDLEKYTFDIVLTLDNHTITDINFRTWEYIKPEKEKLLDGIVSNPNAWLREIMPDIIYEGLTNAINTITDRYISKLSKLNIEKKSYSSYKLFYKSNLSADDKLYIMQRYGLIRIVDYICCIFNEDIVVEVGNISFDIKLFLTKCRALIIEMLWNDKQQNKSITIIDEIFAKNKGLIPDEFYKINRKFRDNFHYSYYDNISKLDIDFVIKHQKIYIQNILDVFNNYYRY